MTTNGSSNGSGATPVLECRNLSISFFTRAGEIPAVENFNLRLMPGEAHGIVGESGCGKSTVALAIMQYLGQNGRIMGGEIFFEGRDMRTMNAEELRKIRGSRIAMVYQEPMASLNPAMLIGEQLAEVPRFHEGASKEEAMERAKQMLANVRVPDPDRIMGSYPHQISGGQQQRVVIAMALLSNPKLLLLDEPTTALDVTVEAGIVELIKEIAAKFGTSMIYISHNLGLILETCDRITVMYSGEAVEVGSVEEVFEAMRHPYTRGLFASIPVPGADKTSRPLIAIPGQLPLPHNRPPGCNFGPRCSYFLAGACDAGEIPMVPVPSRQFHASRCIRIDEIDWYAPPAGAVARPATEPGDVVLKVDDLTKHYSIEKGALFFSGEKKTVKANEKLNFNARQAETVAIVGESGCGKSTFAKVLMGLEPATSGSVTLGNLELGDLPVQKRGAGTISHLQMVFQNPFDTLNPSHSVGGADRPRHPQIQGGDGRGEGAGAGDASARHRQAAAGFRQAPAAPALRRPEAAHRHRARLRRQSGRGDRRRAGLGARRLGAGCGDRAADGYPARQPHDASLHQPRSLGGALSLRPHRRDVSRADHGAGDDGPDFRAAVSSVYGGAALGRPDRRHQDQEAQGAVDRRDPVAVESAAGLSVLHALPIYDARPLRRRPATDRRARTGSPHPLPSADRYADGDGAGDPDRAACAAAPAGDRSDFELTGSLAALPGFPRALREQ